MNRTGNKSCCADYDEEQVAWKLMALSKSRDRHSNPYVQCSYCTKSEPDYPMYSLQSHGPMKHQKMFMELGHYYCEDCIQDAEEINYENRPETWTWVHVLHQVKTE